MTAVQQVGQITASASAPRPALAGRCVLVVGGAGYIGSVLTGALLEAGARVRILDLLVYGHGFAVRPLSGHPRCEVLVADLCDQVVVRNALEGCTDVVQLAALAGEQICNRQPGLAVRVNQRGANRVYDLLRDSDVEHFVLASTCRVYGGGDGPAAAEDEVLRPATVYADTKAASEHYVSGLRGEMPVATTVLRLAETYGLSARLRLDLDVARLASALLAGRPVTLEHPDTVRPYCHVDDVVETVMTVLGQPGEAVDGAVLNVGRDDQHFTPRQLVAELASHLEGASVFCGPARPSRQRRVSFSRLSDHLGVQPRRTVQEHLPELVETLRRGVLDHANAHPDAYVNHDVRSDLQPPGARGGVRR